jgi:PPOX class probable F420-dependent enzyme
METPWIAEAYQDLISDETRAFAILATLMKDGTPQATPIWFNTLNPHFLINSALGRIKDKNMRRNVMVALTILDPKNPYRYIQVRGRVAEITENGAREHIDALAGKYTGTPKYKFSAPGEVRVIYKILPEHIQVRG